MFTRQSVPREQFATKERRTRLTEWVNELKSELHWDTYFSRYPEAAQHALREVERIIDEEIEKQKRALELAPV